MEPFVNHTGLVAPLDRPNVDTDQIIPKQFLKRIERSGFGQFLFFDWRLTPQGEPREDFVLNQSRYTGASVLLARTNFGCGSSREHAPWSLKDYGFRVLIAPSFADIFYNNCFKNSILPITVSETECDELFLNTEKNPGYELRADLEKCQLTDQQGLLIPIQIDDFRRECLMGGLDDIGLTLQHEDRIATYEQRQT